MSFVKLVLILSVVRGGGDCSDETNFDMGNDIRPCWYNSYSSSTVSLAINRFLDNSTPYTVTTVSILPVMTYWDA